MSDDRGLLERAARLAKGRLSTEQHYEGADLGTALHLWFPRVAGEAVTIKPSTQFPRGYTTREAALEAARDYRQRCRRFVAEHAHPTAGSEG